MTSLATRVTFRRPNARLLSTTSAPQARLAAETPDPALVDVVAAASASVVYRFHQDDAYMALRVQVPRQFAGDIAEVRFGLGVPRGFDPLVVFGEAGRDLCHWTELPAGAWPQTKAGPLVSLDLQVIGSSGPLPFRLLYPADDGESTVADSPRGERVRVRALARQSAHWC